MKEKEYINNIKNIAQHYCWNKHTFWGVRAFAVPFLLPKPQ